MAHVFISETDFSELLKKTVTTALKEFQAQSKPDNNLITQLQTAEKLKISVPTLNKWKEQGLIPFTQVGRKIFFKNQDVLNALDSLSNKHQKRG